MEPGLSHHAVAPPLELPPLLLLLLPDAALAADVAAPEVEEEDTPLEGAWLVPPPWDVLDTVELLLPPVDEPAPEVPPLDELLLPDGLVQAAAQRTRQQAAFFMVNHVRRRRNDRVLPQARHPVPPP